jgi:hypothetical protein
MKVTEFIKFRRLQWVGHVNRMEENRIPKKALQQTIHGKRRAENSRKLWEDAVREDAVELLAIRAWKIRAKESSGGNAYRRLRLHMGCNAIAAAADGKIYSGSRQLRRLCTVNY